MTLSPESKPWEAPSSSPVRSSVDALQLALAELALRPAQGSSSRVRLQLDALLISEFLSLMPNCASRFVMEADCVGSN